ncbi:MAG: transcriptional regulator [Parasphingorhabdus sp.]|jgi:transcriptional regulator
MYLPKYFEESNPQAIANLILDYPLGTWICVVDGNLVANHVPFLFDPDSAENGILSCHLAKPNPLWKVLSEETENLITFQGPNGYVTPSWYPTKKQTGQVVPTWNYIVVHIYGTAKIIQDRQWLKDHVTKQTNLREKTQTVPWSVSDAPEEYIEKMLCGIVGIEITVSRILGKTKLSQNKNRSDQLGVAEGLLALDGESMLEMGNRIGQGLKND